MTLKLSELVKDKSKIDLQDICSDWTWLVSGQKSILLVTVFGDLFFVGQSDEINWLDTGSGKLTRVADSVKHFEELLKDKDNFSEWFMTNLYSELQQKGIKLKDNEVYGFKKIPVIGGDYSSDNFEPTDMSVHFSISGQICKQIKDLPDGTNVNIKTAILDQKPWWKIWK